MRLKGRIALVSGAHQGIGQGVALRYAQEGAMVYCADIGNCVETLKLIKDAGGRSKAVALQVTDHQAWQSVVDGIIAAESKIDILANVAGVVARGTDSALDLSLDEWDRVIGIDLKGVWLGMRSVLPHMRKAKYGRIVNVSSMASLRGLPGLFVYSTAKGGVAAMTRQAAVDYAREGITVNAIAPGTIDTPILADITDEMREQFVATHAIPRFGLPSDIAAMAAFLGSDDASFVTGLNIPCDGGWSVK